MADSRADPPTDTFPTGGVLLDIDGVLVRSRPLPGAVAAVEALRSAGLPVVFVTNTTSRSVADIAGALGELGIAVPDGDLVTAGVATAELLAREHPGRRLLVLDDGPGDALSALDVVRPGEAGRDTADVVVVGSAGPEFTWEVVNAAARLLVGGAALVAMHGALVWSTDEGLCVDGAAYVTMLEAATGARATVVGKPAPTMFLEGARRLGRPPGEVVMVGDDLHADVLAAQEVGMRGVQVRTGKFRQAALDAADVDPWAVVDSIAEVPGLLGIATPQPP